MICSESVASAEYSAKPAVHWLPAQWELGAWGSLACTVPGTQLVLNKYLLSEARLKWRVLPQLSEQGPVLLNFLSSHAYQHLAMQHPERGRPWLAWTQGRTAMGCDLRHSGQTPLKGSTAFLAGQTWISGVGVVFWRSHPTFWMLPRPQYNSHLNPTATIAFVGYHPPPRPG